MLCRRGSLLRSGRRHIWEADCGGDLNRWALVWSAEGSPEMVSGAAVSRAEAAVIWHRPAWILRRLKVGPGHWSEGENDASASSRYKRPAVRSNRLCALEPSSRSRCRTGSRQLTHRSLHRRGDDDAHLRGVASLLALNLQQVCVAQRHGQRSY